MKSFAHDITGMPVHASDGEIGTIHDVYFDPDTWTVRYLEVSTGWLFGRDVLIPVSRVTSIDAPDGVATFDCTREQIENSPSADPERPIDRDYESRLLSHYGMSPYWAAPPEVGAPPQPLPVEQRPPETTAEQGERRLLSVRDIDGFDLEARGEIVGTVRDVLLEFDTWKVTSLMADLGGLFTQDAETIGVGPVLGIDRDNGIVRISTSPDEIGHGGAAENLPYVFPYVPPIA